LHGASKDFRQTFDIGKPDVSVEARGAQVLNVPKYVLVVAKGLLLNHTLHQVVEYAPSDRVELRKLRVLCEGIVVQ